MKTNTTEYSLFDREIEANFSDYTFYLMIEDFAGAMGYWLCENKLKSGIDVNKPLDAFIKVIQEKYFEKKDSVMHINYKVLKSIFEEGLLFSIPEFREIARTECYDLQVLAKNVFYSICREEITQPL